MRRYLLSGIAPVMAGLIISACGQPLDLDMQSDMRVNAEIGAVIRATQEANNAGDPEAWVALFDDDFRYLGPWSPAITDRDSLFAYAESGFSSWRSEIIIEPTDIVASGDWAFVTSEVRGRAVSIETGDVETVDVKQLVVYRQRRSGWRIARLAISPN